MLTNFKGDLMKRAWLLTYPTIPLLALAMFCSQTISAVRMPLTPQDQPDKDPTSSKLKSSAQIAKEQKPKHIRKKNKSGYLARHSKQEAKRTLSVMTYEELKQAKDRQIAANNTEAAIKYIERMLKLCDDINEIAALMIDLADLYFDNGDLTKAGTLYTEFTRMYPGNKKTEYALYRGILSSFYSTLTIDRDQSMTHKTIELSDQFLGRDLFTQYKDEVEKIRQQCYQKVVESEFNVCDF